MNEHGIAYNALGEEKIIVVYNSSLGSLNDHPEEIAFDLRHLRFPIQYNYSKKTTDVAAAKKNFIITLTEALKNTTIYAVQHQKNKYNPFIVWSDWQEQKYSSAQKFISNPRVAEISKSLLEGINNPKETIRFLGLSGLGKTRILFEAFRPSSLESSIMLSGRILYFDCNSDVSPDYSNIFTNLNQKEEDRIVVLDNCSKELHRSIQKMLDRDNNKVSLITVNSNPEEIEQDKINGVNYLVIKKEDLASIVDEILNLKFKQLGEVALRQIKEFAQGIPMMAVLLAQSAENGEQYIGKLDDKELLNKLLGALGSDEDNRTILKSSSIFSYFGYYDEFRPQMEFIANNKNITALDGTVPVLNEKFTKICEHYIRREIFERRGRLIGMRPFPLALSLALEWLDLCTPNRLVKLIEDIALLTEPARSHLSEGLAEHMKYLGYSSKAQYLLDKIIGPGSPFDNAEVLNTELGSRLFRSFVEVNPIAVSDNLSRVFSAKSTDELLLVEKGRRNLIWTLEKLCFDKRTFSKSVRTLFAFALAENETWSNNATGQFLHLFNIMLPGTEANLDERWEILLWVLNQNNPKGIQLALQAMNRGLNTRYFNRTLGGERQGTKKLIDYDPSPQEVKKYWDSILKKLIEFVKAGGQYSEMASDIIANTIRGICNAGFFETIIPFVQDVAQQKNNDWDKGLNNLRHTKKYEKNTLNPEQLEIISELINKLTKLDFITRYKVVSNSYTLDDDISLNKDAVVVAVNGLADEFIANHVPWENSLPIFYKGAQMNAAIFGRRLYELLSSDNNTIDDFINQSLTAIRVIPKDERNPALLAGFLLEANKELRQRFYVLISNTDDLSYLLFYFIAHDIIGKEFLKLLFELVDSGKCAVANFKALRYSNALQNMNIEEILKFSELLFKYGIEGYSIAFELFFDPLPGGEDRKKKLYPLYKNCIKAIAIPITIAIH